MAGFKVRAETAGENVLAQKMAFKRGYAWWHERADGRNIKFGEGGLCLFFDPSSKYITQTSYDRAEFFASHENVEVTLSDIAAWPLEK